MRQNFDRIGLPLLSIVAGGLLLWFGKSLLEIDNDWLLGLLLIIPLASFVSYSRLFGRIAVGNLLILEQPVSQSVNLAPLAGQIADSLSRDIERVVKGDPSALAEVGNKLRRMESEKPVILYLYTGHSYTVADIEAYIRNLGHLRSFKFVVIADPNDTIIAYAPYYTLQHILSLETRAGVLLTAIETGEGGMLRSYPGIRTAFLSSTDTIRQALQIMLKERLEAMIVIDGSGKAIGVVERDELITKVVLAINV